MTSLEKDGCPQTRAVINTAWRNIEDPPGHEPNSARAMMSSWMDFPKSQK